MILSYPNINPELLIKVVASKGKMWAETPSLGYLTPLGKSSAFLGKGWVGSNW